MVISSNEVGVLQRVTSTVKRLTPEARQVLVCELSNNVCPECGSMDIHLAPNGAKERVCKTCGLVQESNIPRYEPGFEPRANTSNLSYGRSLGSVMGPYDTYKILSKTVPITDKPLPEGTSKELKHFLDKNIGLRARFIRIYNSTCDHPAIKKMLTLGEKLCTEFDIYGNTEEIIKFRDYFGKLLRKVGGLALHMKMPYETFSARHLTVATFVYCWQLMEKQHGARTLIRYSKTFPSFNSRYHRGLKSVELHKYTVNKEVWGFVLFAVQQSPNAPCRVIGDKKEEHNGRLIKKS